MRAGWKLWQTLRPPGGDCLPRFAEPIYSPLDHIAGFQVLRRTLTKGNSGWCSRAWLDRIDVGLARSFAIREGKELQFQAQAFNLFNHANYYVQNGDGINQLQYNPIGTNCGDGLSLNQSCYLVPNSGPGNFGTFGEISPNGLPRVLQFSVRFRF
jgi:hypothetical protein